MTIHSMLGLVPIVLSMPSGTSNFCSDRNGIFLDHLENVLGTSLDLKIVAQSLGAARQAEQLLLSEISRLDKVLSGYRADSEFSRWLAAPIQKAVGVSGDLFAVLRAFDFWREATGGALNAGTDSIGLLWQLATQDQSVPTAATLQQAVAAVHQTHWFLDQERQTATRLTAVPLRLNTFTKSYILNRAADHALRVAGVEGLVLNGGGDILVRGNCQEVVAVADPLADAVNAAPIDRLFVQNATVATSGNYRRGWRVAGEWVSHILDPRTGQPARDIISATVLHPDAVTAGALATAFNLLPPSESAQLAARFAGTEYTLITRNGQTITSAGWPGAPLPVPGQSARLPEPTVAHLLSLPTKDKPWNPGQELVITLELARIEGRAHRPFVAVWIEDEAGKPVRQLALWYNKPRWLHELRAWSGLQTDGAASVTSATRSPGAYSLVWDGKDDSGQLVKQGKYTVLIEAAREHGTYQLIRQTMDFNGKVKQQTLPGNVEIAAAALDYREKPTTR